MAVAIVWLNLLGALGAIGSNAYGAARGNPISRPWFGAVCAVAVFYAAGYVWLLTTGDFAAWSEFFRSVSLLVWPLVWWVPAILSVRTKRARVVESAALILATRASTAASTNGDHAPEPTFGGRP